MQGNNPQGAKKMNFSPTETTTDVFRQREMPNSQPAWRMSWKNYEMPYDPAVPVVCMDEKSKYQERYLQHICVARALGGMQYVSVREHRTVADWAEEIKSLYRYQLS